jgi:methylthioribulose-1-phosphate dehydratase
MINDLIKTIRSYHNRGWSPATSTNYSFIDENFKIWITRSGVDKSIVSENDFIQIDVNGILLIEDINIKTSAETQIHCAIYKLFPNTKVILHSHGIYPNLLSSKMKNQFVFEGNEIQKGFNGITTHLGMVRIPILDNNQNMQFFEKELNLRKLELNHHCFSIRNHGTYAWGVSILEAKKHLETLDYLCQYEWNLISN